MAINPYDLGRRFVGIAETPGLTSNPLILAMLQIVDPSVHDEQTAWCSAYVNFCCWLANLPMSHSLSARSWLRMGTPVDLTSAMKGDVVVLKRGNPPQPGPEVIQAPGHVGFFDRFDGTFVWILGGNQGNSVSIAPFTAANVLGVRRVM